MDKSVKQWSDVSLGAYVELYDILSSDSEDKTFDILSVLYDISMEEVEALDYTDYAIMERDLQFISRPIPKHSDSFKHSGVDFQLMEFNMIEFGAFIDLEALITDKDNIIGNLPKIYAILYRPVIKEGTVLHPPVLDSYGSWLDMRAVLFESIPLTHVYGAITEYNKFRDVLFKQYHGMFETKEEMTAEDKAQLEIEKMHMTATERKEEEKLERVNKWSWELLLLKLANNEPLKIDNATMLPLVEAMNILSLFHELGLSGE